jgi:hypothetical protein
MHVHRISISARLERLEAGPSTTLRASVGSVVTGADKAATTVVPEVWNPGAEYEMTRDVTVELQMMDIQWKASKIVCK